MKKCIIIFISILQAAVLYSQSDPLLKKNDNTFLSTKKSGLSIALSTDFLFFGPVISGEMFFPIGKGTKAIGLFAGYRYIRGGCAARSLLSWLQSSSYTVPISFRFYNKTGIWWGPWVEFGKCEYSRVKDDRVLVRGIEGGSKHIYKNGATLESTIMFGHSKLEGGFQETAFWVPLYITFRIGVTI
ncbi:hypothetical protein JW835_09325 [bacterium]|nr:hypothetical protein [bacterium]